MCCMFNLIAGKQGYYRSITFQVSTTSREGLQPLSFICSVSESFRPVEHLTVRKRWNISANKSGYSAGEWIYVSIDLIFLSLSTLVRIRAPSPTLFSQICYLTKWILVWNFQIYQDLNYFDLLCSFLFSIYQFLPWLGIFMTWFVVLLDVLDLHKEPHMSCWWGAVPSPKFS